MVFSCEEEEVVVDLADVYWTVESIRDYKSELLNTTNFPGDLYLGYEAGADLSAFQNIEVIEGDLLIFSTQADALTSFSSLRWVHNITLRTNTLMERIAFPALQTMDSLRIFTHELLQEVGFLALEQVVYTSIYNNMVLLSVRMPLLQDFSTLLIWRNNQLCELVCCEHLMSSQPSDQSYRRVAPGVCQITITAFFISQQPHPALPDPQVSRSR